jgi:hypothetical protein
VDVVSPPPPDSMTTTSSISMASMSGNKRKQRGGTGPVIEDFSDDLNRRVSGLANFSLRFQGRFFNCAFFFSFLALVVVFFVQLLSHTHNEIL